MSWHDDDWNVDVYNVMMKSLQWPWHDEKDLKVSELSMKWQVLLKKVYEWNELMAKVLIINENVMCWWMKWDDMKKVW